MGDEDGGSLVRARANGHVKTQPENREIGGCLPLLNAVVFPEEKKVNSIDIRLNQAPSVGAGLGSEALEELCAGLLVTSASKMPPPLS